MMDKYIKTHWAGQFPLWKSYWINSVIISNIAIFVLAIITGIILGIFLSIFHIPNPGTGFWDIVASIISVPVVVWSFIGTWRSAINYKLERPGETFNWGTIAQVFIILGTLKSVAYIISLSL